MTSSALGWRGVGTLSGTGSLPKSALNLEIGHPKRVAVLTTTL